MKLHAQRKELISALEKTAYADSGNLHASAGKTLLTPLTPEGGDPLLQLYANDLAMSIDVAVPAEVETTGAVGINTKALISIVKAMPDGKLTLALHGTKLVISGANRRRSTLPTVAHAAFPTPPEPPEDAPRCLLPTDTLGGLIATVRHAISPPGPDHLQMQSVRLEIDKGQAVAVATDGHRITKATKPIDRTFTFTDPSLKFEASIPGILVKALEKLCGREKSVMLITTERGMFIETDDVLIGLLLPRIDFPPWENMFSGLTPSAAGSVKTDLLLEALQGIAAARMSGGHVQLSCRAPFEWLDLQLVGDDNSAEDHIALIDGAVPFSVGFSMPYLLDAARAAGDDIQIQISDLGSGNTAVLLATGEEFLSLICTIRG